MRRLAVNLAVAALVAATAWATTLSDRAEASTCEGVWVVVDPGPLGGSVITRCVPGDPRTGIEALTSAGFSYEYVASFPGLVCRINDRPGTDVTDCQHAPPSDAYWSYWYAEAGGSWTYARTGAHLRDPKPGQVEGWSYGAGSAPSVSPPAPPPPPPPSEPDPDDGQAGRGQSQSGSSGGGSASDGGSSSASGSSSAGSASNVDDTSSSGGVGAVSGGTSTSSTEEGSPTRPDADGSDSGDEGEPAPSPPSGSNYGLPDVALPEADTQAPTRSLDPETGDTEGSAGDADDDDHRADATLDAVIVDSAGTQGGWAASGVLTTGVLLAGVTAFGVFQHRRRRDEV